MCAAHPLPPGYGSNYSENPPDLPRRHCRDALHSLDYPALNRHPLVWRVVLLSLLSGGALLAITGVVLAIRRLRRTKRAGRVSP